MLNYLDRFPDLNQFGPRGLCFLNLEELPCRQFPSKFHLGTIHLNCGRDIIGGRLLIYHQITFHLELQFFLRRFLVIEEFLVELEHNELVDFWQVHSVVFAHRVILQNLSFHPIIKLIEYFFYASKVPILTAEELYQNTCLPHFMHEIQNALDVMTMLLFVIPWDFSDVFDFFDVDKVRNWVSHWCGLWQCLRDPHERIFALRWLRTISHTHLDDFREVLVLKQKVEGQVSLQWLFHPLL